MDENTPYSSIGDMLTGAANAALSQTSTSRKAKRNARQQAKAQRELKKDQEARPYAYQQLAVRNAYTLGAPSSDAEAKKLALAAAQRFNSLEMTKGVSPQEIAAAKAEADSWYRWAAMPQATRNNILQRGRKQAEMGAAKNQFAGIMNERQTPGAAELLQYEADVMAGRNPNAFKSETSSTGRKVVYKDGIPVGFSGAPPSQIIGDAGERSMVNRTGLLSPQERQAIRDQAIAEAVNPTSPVDRNALRNQAIATAMDQTRSGKPMLMDTIKSPAANLLMQPAPATQVAVAPVAPVPAAQTPAVAPVAQQPAPVPVGAGARAIDTLVGSDLANPEDLDERAQDNFMQSQAGQALWKATGGDAAVRKSSGAYAADLANAVGNAGTRLYAGAGRAMNPVLRQAKENLALSTLGQFLGMTPPTR
jgi:hypothetical protein